MKKYLKSAVNVLKPRIRENCDKQVTDSNMLVAIGVKGPGTQLF